MITQHAKYECPKEEKKKEEPEPVSQASSKKVQLISED